MNPQQTTSLSIETVKHIAQLSRLALNDDEVKHFHKELERVLQAFQTLAKMQIPENLSETQSSFVLDNINQNSIVDEKYSHMQSDVCHNSVSTQDFISSTPDHEGVFVRVPAVLNQEN